MPHQFDFEPADDFVSAAELATVGIRVRRRRDERVTLRFGQGRVRTRTDEVGFVSPRVLGKVRLASLGAAR